MPTTTSSCERPLLEILHHRFVSQVLLEGASCSSDSSFVVHVFHITISKMVSSQISSFTGTETCKSFQKKLFVLVEPPDVVPSEHAEFDFSDVFGPLPVQAAGDVGQDSGSSGPVLDSNDVAYDEPVVIHNRSIYAHIF